MTDLVMHQGDSCENMKEFIMTSAHVMPHPIISQIVNADPKMNTSITRHL